MTGRSTPHAMSGHEHVSCIPGFSHCCSTHMHHVSIDHLAVLFAHRQVDLGAELVHGDETSLYRLAKEKGWEMEELISLAQGDGGPLPADSNDGFGLFYLGGEKRMLAMDSKVQL